jgi:hypothetical protein
MKYNNKVVINLSREKTIERWFDESHFSEWQENYLRTELISGTQYEENAKSILFYQQGSAEMMLEETIISNNLPESIEGFYEHLHMDNTQKIVFKEIGKNTEITAYVEYTKFKGPIENKIDEPMKIFFKNQNQKRLDSFKEFSKSGK